jgi:two-component system, OmpR family, sensor histidine kinase VicK
MKKWKQLMNSVQWKLVVIYILLIIMAMQLVGVYFIRQLESVFINDLRAQLKEQGYVLSLIVSSGCGPACCKRRPTLASISPSCA